MLGFIIQVLGEFWVTPDNNSAIKDCLTRVIRYNNVLISGFAGLKILGFPLNALVLSKMFIFPKIITRGMLCHSFSSNDYANVKVRYMWIKKTSMKWSVHIGQHIH